MTFRSNPFDQMDRLFEQTRRSMGFPVVGRVDVRTPALGARDDGVDVLSTTDANVGMEPTDEGYVVTADLPGFEREDLELTFDDGVLTVQGSVDVSEEHDGSWQRRSRHVHEQIAIPGTVREDDIEAAYRNGVLEVHLATDEAGEEDGYRIQIE